MTFAFSRLFVILSFVFICAPAVNGEATVSDLHSVVHEKQRELDRHYELSKNGVVPAAQLQTLEHELLNAQIELAIERGDIAAAAKLSESVHDKLKLEHARLHTLSSKGVVSARTMRSATVSLRNAEFRLLQLQGRTEELDSPMTKTIDEANRDLARVRRLVAKRVVSAKHTLKYENELKVLKNKRRVLRQRKPDQ